MHLRDNRCLAHPTNWNFLGEKRVGWRTLRRLSLGLSLLPLGGCEPSVFDAAGVIGANDWQILIDSVVIMLAIIIPTISVTVAFAWWYRETNLRARYRPDFAHSGRIEMVVWGVPLLTIMLLGGVAWVGSHELDPGAPIASDKPTMEVDVVSLDWKWLFIYPGQHLATVNELELPVGVPVRFILTSDSVMNTFFIPNLGSMIYTMNGMTTKLHLRADRVGTYHGMSTMFSGDGFSGMEFDTRAVPQDQFNAWVDETKQKGPVLDRAAYTELQKQTLNVKPFTYRDIDPSLFAKVVSQEIPPGGGPPEEAENREVSPRAH